MKISFAASIRGKEKYGQYYRKIIEYLTKEGHLVHHTLSISMKDLATFTASQRIKIFHEFYKRINKSDLLIAECSFPSINVAYEISHGLQQGKSVIILHLKSDDGMLAELRDPIFHSDKISIYEYTEKTLVNILRTSIQLSLPQLDKRFTIILPSSMMAELDNISKKKKIPKAVYIRQLIEKDLQYLKSS